MIPDGSIRKLKARFCARGYEQIEAVDYCETFAPVVNWTAVRFLLMMSILLDLETKQVDYVAAFIQADIDTTVYVEIEMPKVFVQPGKILQYARFANSPRRSHEQALERIGQYLKSTSNKRLLLHPTNFTDTFSTDVYVDVDFARGWGYKDPNDPICVKSRTDFLIEIMGCPILWTLKLQSNIATSSMEAEYTALSLVALAFLFLRLSNM
jgi:hypothetical protein